MPCLEVLQLVRPRNYPWRKSDLDYKLKEEKSFYKPERRCFLSEGMSEFSHCVATRVAVVANFLCPRTTGKDLPVQKTHIHWPLQHAAAQQLPTESYGAQGPCRGCKRTATGP